MVAVGRERPRENLESPTSGGPLAAARGLMVHCRSIRRRSPERMTGMSEETIFVTALEKSTSAERDAYLDNACAGDHGLRRRVEALLRATRAVGRPPRSGPIGQGGGGWACAGGALSWHRPTVRRGPRTLHRAIPDHREDRRGRHGSGLPGPPGPPQPPLCLEDDPCRGLASVRETDRFLAEAEAVAKLSDPNIVQVYSLGEWEGLPYLELEYVEGGSLADRLDGTPRPPEEAARLVETLARSIGVAHARGSSIAISSRRTCC